MPTIALLIFLTDEVSHLINRVSLAIPIFSTNAQTLLLAAFIASFLFTFLLHQHYVRKQTYSVLATFHIPIQLVIVAICFFLIVPFRPEMTKMESSASYLFFGFLLSVAISDATYFVDYRKRQPMHLISIENALSKESLSEDERKPSFFRLGGFLWVDFQHEMAVERDEIEELLARLANEKAILLVGHQASGKSVILKNLGYRLARYRRYVVLFANADSLNADLALQDIRNWDMSNVVVLIDDVHRNPTACSNFLERARCHNIKIVLSSRPLNVNVFREGGGVQLVRLFEKRVEAEVTEEVISEMIEVYCRSINLRFKPERKEVNEIIRKCGTDLWLITYLLASWNPRKSKIEKLARDDIYEKVYETRIRGWGITSKSSIEMMQTICALYQYEIPCAESYLVEVGLSDEAFRLESEGQVIRRSGYYYLHHPSVARIYLETLGFFKLIEDVDRVSIEVLSSYLEKSREERARVFFKLSTFPKSAEDTIAILRRMLKTVRFEELVHQIEQETHIGKIGSFFRSISNVDRASAEALLRMVGRESLTRKLIGEPVAKRRRSLISDISRLDNDLARLLSERNPVVAAVVPLFNEEKIISYLLKDLLDYVDTVIVVDDGSRDATVKLAQQLGAKVVLQPGPKGISLSILAALKMSLENADAVVLDIFPWVDCRSIPKLVAPILRQEADLVIGLHKENPCRIQAINRKGVEKFLKYLPNLLSKSGQELSLTKVLFSKILRVRETAIDYLPIPYGKMALYLSSRRAYMRMRGYYGGDPWMHARDYVAESLERQEPM